MANMFGTSTVGTVDGFGAPAVDGTAAKVGAGYFVKLSVAEFDKKGKGLVTTEAIPQGRLVFDDNVEDSEHVFNN